MQTRYRESRTLVRRLCRQPGEDKATFRDHKKVLRSHFEAFNLDVSGLCQWIMGLRKSAGDPARPEWFGTLGEFMLRGNIDGQADEESCDRLRRDVFDYLAGISVNSPLPDSPACKSLSDAMAAGQNLTPTAQRLFARLRKKEPGHRLVLLKAAAEWIVARYQRGVENWQRQHAEWQNEKQEWEQKNPQLTEDIRAEFTGVFQHLNTSESGQNTGLRRKNPRLCPWDRLKQNTDNCIYAGQKGHGPLCWKYVEFLKSAKSKDNHFNPKSFSERMTKLIDFCRNYNIQKVANAFINPNFAAQLTEQTKAGQARAAAVTHLKKDFDAYLKFMNLTAETVLNAGRLPHCLKIGEVWEKSTCQFNPHTDLCQQYRRALASLPAELLDVEARYRQWRKLYLAGPRKPSFKYPSSRKLPMPKIFGAGFYRVDFNRSVVGLRLDGTAADQWLEFGFTPWPRKYSPSRREAAARVTSVHVHFVGTRARIGFRFAAPHKASRFSCTQDELDELRSRRFPRWSQDQLFLEAARGRLLPSFAPDDVSKLRLLAVDLGETGACAAIYEGPNHLVDVPLKINKIDALYSQLPGVLEKDRSQTPPKQFNASQDARGVRKQHVARHLATLAQGAAEIAQARDLENHTPVTLHSHDFRELQLHTAWMIRDWARLNAAQIVAAAEQHGCDLIVFESQRGFKASVPGYDAVSKESRNAKLFAFGRVRKKVIEKAVERGMRVITVPYHKSSQYCSKCGASQSNRGLWRKNKKAHQFICEHKTCGLKMNADQNAARVLARVFWGDIQLPVAQIADLTSAVAPI